MRPHNYLIVSGLVLALGLVALLSAPRRAENAGKPPAPASSDQRASRDEAAACPKGQLDDFGVCVPVAHPPSPAHVGPTRPRPDERAR